MAKLGDIETLQPQDRSLEDALAVLQLFTGKVGMVNSRAVMGSFNVLPLDASSKREHRLITRSGNEHDGLVSASRTEFNQNLYHELEAEGKQAYVFSIAFAFQIDFQFQDDAALEDRKTFCRAAGVAISWPYWREFFGNAMARMQIIGPPQGLMTSERAARMAGFVPQSELTARREAMQAERQIGRAHV